MKNSLKSIFSENICTIGIVATAGRVDMQLFAAVADQLTASGITVKNYLPEPESDTPQYLAAAAEKRLENFNRAVNDPTLDLIICARGGFGSVHLLDRIDYAALRSRRLPVMGYSDITSLHCAMLSENITSVISGSNCLSLEQAAADALSIASHRAAMDTSDKLHTIDLAPGTLTPVLPEAENSPVCARSYAANLTVLCSLCGSKYLPDFQDMILILEDVNEPVYKIDRMLCQLRLNGVFDRTAAVVFGSFTGENDAHGLEDLFRRTAAALPCPCWKGFPFGHTFPMCAVNSGKYLTIQPDRVQISLANLS